VALRADAAPSSLFGRNIAQDVATFDDKVRPVMAPGIKRDEFVMDKFFMPLQSRRPFGTRHPCNCPSSPI
jgi:hypothetical protein